MAEAQARETPLGAVLLVEPDEGMRWALELILVDMGCQVRCAGDGGEAIRRASESTRPPDLVVAEFRLPDLSGAELARLLGERGDPVPVLLVSWDSPEQLRGMGVDPGPWPLLRKPIQLNDFTRLVRALLHARADVGAPGVPRPSQRAAAADET